MENGFGYSYGGYGGYGRNESIPERSVVCVRATVMLFDNEMKRWIASGPFAGLSRIQIYHQTYNNTFRINGIRMDSGEVSLDCDVTQSLVYNPATPIFHQWKQDGRIVGLHFNSENEAREFSRAIDSALETLNNPVNYSSTSNYRGYGSEPEVTTARPTHAASESTRPGAMTPTANSSPEVIETTTATTITPKARTPEATSATTASLAPATTVTTPPEATPTTTTTATNFASYTPASITPPASSASKAAFESATASPSVVVAAAAAAAASDAAPKVTSPKFQTSCRFVPKAQTNTTANELSSSSSSPPAYVTPTAAVSSPPPPATPGTPSYVGTTSSIPQQSYSYKEQAELKDNERGGVNVFPVQSTDVASVVENQSTADVASNIPPVTTNQVETTVVPEGPPPFVPPPPPPPPPPPVCITAPCGDLGSALAGAQLRKARADEESGGGTLSRSASPSLSDLQSDIMSEMARKLKERKARANATPSPVPAPTNNASSSGTVSQLEPVTLQERRASFDRGHERRPSVDRCRSPIPSQPSSATSKPPAVNNNITDSPKFPRSKRIQSLTGQEGPPSVGSGAGAAAGGQGSYATSAELESVKQELMQFVRTEVTKAKQEIIDAVRLLLLRQQ